VKEKVYRPIAEVRPLLADIAIAFGKREIRHQLCGSIRRGASVFGDVDYVVLDSLADVMDAFRTVEGAECFDLAENRKSFSVMVRGVQVDVYKATDEDFGAMTLFLTGSAFLNILMRGYAKKQGLLLNQYGLWNGDMRLAGRTEEQMFYALGLKYLKPEERSIVKTDKGKKILVPV